MRAREKKGRLALADMSCPDCYGVLRRAREGPQHVPRFVCRVGHAFSLESLIDAKRDRLEDALWSTIILLDDVAGLEEEASLVTRDRASASRARLARKEAALLRRLVQKKSA